MANSSNTFKSLGPIFKKVYDKPKKEKKDKPMFEKLRKLYGR